MSVWRKWNCTHQNDAEMRLSSWKNAGSSPVTLANLKPMNNDFSEESQRVGSAAPAGPDQRHSVKWSEKE